MPRARTILLLVATVSLSAIALGALTRKPAPGTAEARHAGTWRDATLLLTLRPDGLYWTAIASTDGALAPSECGRWHVGGRALEMRSSWSAVASTGSTIRLSQPGLHFATVSGDPGGSLTLYTAIPGKSKGKDRPAISVLRRTAPPASRSTTPAGRRALERECGVHLED